MLSELKVKNLALIEHLCLNFGPGANLLTGETGAGKSILVGAFGLLKGQKASAGLVRTGAEETEVEALFVLEHPEKLASLFLAQGLTPAEEIILRRQVSAAGRNRIRLNGSLITLSQLTAWGEELLAVSSQHDQQSLTSPARQADFLDTFGGHQGILNETGKLWRELELAAQALTDLEAELKDSRNKKELYEFQLAEIKKVAPQPEEDLQLLDQKNRHRAGARLIALFNDARELLEFGQDNILAKLDRLKGLISKIASLDPEFQKAAETLDDTSAALSDLAGELKNSHRRTALKDSDLEDIDERLSDLAKLKRKFGPTLEDVLSKESKLKNILNRLDESELEISKLKKILTQAQAAALAKARELSDLRQKAAEKLAGNLEETLKVLGFPKIKIKIEVSPEHSLGPKGFDQVCFLFCPNPGEGLRPLAKIASGGELSRLMLALKIAQEPRSDQSLVFDEIDSGLSGATAEAVAAKMAELTKRQQIFVITHLPQMASLPGNHYLVAKGESSDAGRTVTSINELTYEGRVKELARMLGGACPAPEALALSHRLLGL
ncbi:MAG: DNA repair protein RecN [Deltaproteobacteria bacterium]|jgi:DNA repair protein RecN (Recombination protein N)|nr:DNA repair protein RecN [Deltaproteobacteria bacterium]